MLRRWFVEVEGTVKVGGRPQSSLRAVLLLHLRTASLSPQSHQASTGRSGRIACWPESVPPPTVMCLDGVLAEVLGHFLQLILSLSKHF